MADAAGGEAATALDADEDGELSSEEIAKAHESLLTLQHEPRARNDLRPHGGRRHRRNHHETTGLNGLPADDRDQSDKGKIKRAPSR